MEIPDELVLQWLGRLEADKRTLTALYQASLEKERSSRIYIDENDLFKNDLRVSGTKKGGEKMPPRYADGYMKPKKNGFRYVFYEEKVRYDIWKKTEKECYDYRTKVIKGQLKKDEKKSILTISGFLNEWYETYKVPYNGEKSLIMTKAYIEKINDYFGKDAKIAKISEIEAQKFINKFSKTPNTQRKYFLLLRSAFEKAFRMGKIKTNPFSCVQLMPHKEQSYRALNFSEQQKIFEKIENQKYKTLYFFCCVTGIRIDRVLNLTKENFDLEKRKIIVKKKQKRGLEETYEVPFLPQLLDFIELKPGKKVFEGITYNSQKLYFSRLYNDLEIKDISAHSFRHTFISTCYSCGIDVKTIQTWAGHSNVEITLNRYTHLLEKGNSAIAEYLKKLRDTLS